MRIPDIPTPIFTLSAVVVGFLLAEGETPNEQNAIGNWLMLVSQYLCTNAAYGQLKQSNTQTPGSFNEYNNANNPNYNNQSMEETLNMLNKMVNALNQEIAEIKKNI